MVMVEHCRVLRPTGLQSIRTLLKESNCGGCAQKQTKPNEGSPEQISHEIQVTSHHTSVSEVAVEAREDIEKPEQMPDAADP